jgi:O-antigen ligase
MAQSAKLRPMLAYVAWEMFLDHPYAGVGLGQYKYADQPYIAARQIDMPLDRIRPYHQHNVFLSLLTETGILGTLPFVWLLAGWTRLAFHVWRRVDAPLELRQTGPVFLFCVASYLANGMFQDVSIIPMVNALLFYVAGLLMSASLKTAVVYPVTLPVVIDADAWRRVVLGRSTGI